MDNPPERNTHEMALSRLNEAAKAVLAAVDSYNENHGTFLGGPCMFELGRSIAAADASLSISPAEGALRAEQIAENANCSRAAIIEECARVAESAARAARSLPRSVAAFRIVAAIRALTPTETGEQGK